MTMAEKRELQMLKSRHAQLVVLIFISIFLLNACKMRFSDPPKEDQAPVVEVEKISLHTSVLSTNDPLKPYSIKVNVTAKNYEGLILVKATEQIIIGKPSHVRVSSNKQEINYSHLSKINQSNFEYIDTNVNPSDTFWYAVIRPAGDGSTGTIEEQGSLPQPSRVQVPAPTSDPVVALSATVENSGSGLKPYAVKLSVTAALGPNSALKLVRAHDVLSLNAGTYTNLANITSNPFSYSDSTLYPSDSAVYAVINNGVQVYQLPAPANVTLPPLNNNFSALALTQIRPLGQMPSIKLTFDPVYGKQVLKRYINGLEVGSVDLSLNQTEHLETEVDFDRLYAFKIEQFDHHNMPSGSSSTLSVKYDWPIVDFSTEFSAKVNPLEAIHEYEMRIQDLSTINRILQVQVSGNGTDFTTQQTLTDTTSLRSIVQNFSSPQTKYWKVVQLDRNNNTLTTSPTYKLDIPRDLEFSGQNTLAQDYSNIGRIKLNSGATLVYGHLDYSISADTLISDNATIRAYLPGARAALDTSGRKAGNLDLVFKKASGTLTVDSRGEQGGNGSQGTAGTVGSTGSTGSVGSNNQLHCIDLGGGMGAEPRSKPGAGGSSGGTGGTGGRGSDGGIGKPGKNGGDSGKITLIVTEEAHSFNPSLITTASAGGTGGSGGSPGSGGPGGPGGAGGRRCWTASQAATAFSSLPCSGMLQYYANTYFCDSASGGDIFNGSAPPNGMTYPNGSQGPQGPSGSTGTPGQNGMPGTANIACSQMPEQTALVCL